MEGTSAIRELLREIHYIDKDVTLAINSINTPFTDSLWALFSNKEIWIVLYLAVLVTFFVRLGWKKALLSLIMCILCVVICDQSCNLCKAFFERLRPCHDLDMISRGLHMLEGKGNLYGFFSAHAANAMGFAMCSYGCLKMGNSKRKSSYGICISIWAILVGISRVFVGKHFLGDVLVGLTYGFIVGSLLALLARQIAKWYSDRQERTPL